jgi:hypothetical protein
MSIQPKPGQKPAFAPANGLRRRVIFELDPEQLPLLEAVRQRHSSTRAALIASLEAEAQVAELRERAEAAEKRAQKAEQEKAARTGKRQKEEATARQLKGAVAEAKERERALSAELKRAREEHAEVETKARREEADYEEALEELQEELAELRERAVDWLFCARCGQWVSPAEWTWQRLKDGGQYAYHRDCGDHKPGFSPSSWLAQRA